MSQNAMHYQCSTKQVDDQLHQIMNSIHEQCIKHGTQSDGYINHVKGANIAGFIKVAKATLSQDIIQISIIYIVLANSNSLK